MARATWTQHNFNGGEWSPLAYGRADIAKYKNGLALCENYIPTPQGGLTRRPGTAYVANVKDSTLAVRLIPFEYSTTQAYVLEFGHQYIRFFTNDGQLKSGGVPYEIASPYLEGDLFDVAFTQSADVMYLVHPSYPPKKLQRLGSTSWTLTDISFQDGPYLATNVTDTTLTPSSTAPGATTITASSTAGINGGTGFTNSDVGRALRIRQGGVWLWGIITAYTDPTHVEWTVAERKGQLVQRTATGYGVAGGGAIISGVITDPGSGYGTVPPTVTVGGAGANGVVSSQLVAGGVGSIFVNAGGTGYTTPVPFTFSAPTNITAAPTTLWRLGVWSSANGYPRAVAFHQDRLWMAGCAAFPSRIDASNTSDYENFAPTDFDGLVTDNRAMSFSLNASKVNAVLWLISDEWGLLAGTASAEWVVAASTTQNALTPTNVSAKTITSYGSTTVPPLRVGKSTLFVQRAKRKVREMNYQFTLGTFQAPDISLVSEHLTKGGLKQLALAQQPYPIVWMCRVDGTLVGLSYDKDQEVVAWHRHTLGGVDTGGAAPAVESVCAIPSPDAGRDELWLSVRRFVNGSILRTVERMTKFWEDGDAVEDAFFVDCGATYSGVATTTVSGLGWLPGTDVAVLADGATHPTATVSGGGVVSLDRSATKVAVGLAYTSQARTLLIEAGGADGAAQGKTKRIHRAIMRFFQSLGLSVRGSGTRGAAYPIPFRSSADLMDRPVALFSGDKVLAWEGTYEREGQVFWETSDPLPSNVTMLSVQLDTQDA